MNERFFIFNERFGCVEAVQWFETREEAEAKKRKNQGLLPDEFVYVGEVLVEIAQNGEVET